ncbi:hypothetical protein, partial [Enterococcus faecalis]|uniref:hypothetical protein n=1 Tax=Enterococcus faecalis TaxID=1351 RepID=UPI00403FA791
MSLSRLGAGLNALVGRISLSWRIVLVAGAVGMAGTAGLVYAVVDTIQGFEQERAAKALDANLNLLRNLVLPNG